jgi:GT2 family glycosyltransferase
MKSLGDNPSVTLAILTKNRLDLLSACCESIFDKVKYKNVTITIIDTGTNEEPVRQYYSTLQSKCDAKNWKYQYIQLDNFHYSKNYNTAIKNYIKTEYVLIQNNDTVALNDYVTEMMGTALMRVAGSVGCRMIYPDKTSIQHDGQTIFNAPNEQFGSASHVNLRVKKENVAQTQSYTHIVDGNTAAGVLMRTQDFIKIEGFDEKFGDIFQDVHLMVKIPNLLNSFNYCNRIANIIHVDNASRLQVGGVDQKKHIQMWEDTHHLRKELIDNKWSKLKKPKQVTFSIITPVYDLDSYKEFINCLNKQVGSYTYEILPVPNFFNHFNSAYKALNTAADLANGEILIYCHDDILVPPDWLNKIKTRLNELGNTPIGVVGPAGITLKDEDEAFFLLNANNIPMNVAKPSITLHKNKVEVHTLDELCLITIKNSGLRFDDNLLTGWHFYGANICIKAIQKGLHNWAIDAYCHHKSGGNKNLDTLEKWNLYEDCARRLNTWAASIGIVAWRTTTAKSFVNTIRLFPTKPTK